MSPPAKIGRYTIKRELGRGGMATVYLAYDSRFRRNVAVKVLPRQFTHDPRYLDRFSHEAQTIASLEHYAIVPVYDFGDHDDAPYLVMRYMQGGSLRERMDGRLLPLDEIVRIIERLAPALDKAHQRGIIHRDLKPGNVLFDEDNQPYLADFGIARMAEATHTMTIVGTPAYMSPEQVEGDQKLDGRSDIYALGVMLFEMLTGTQPYVANTPTKQMMKHVLEPVPNVLQRNPSLPLDTQSIVDKVMAKDRAARYTTATKLAIALRALSNGLVETTAAAVSDTRISPELDADKSVAVAASLSKRPVANILETQSEPTGVVSKPAVGTVIELLSTPAVPMPEPGHKSPRSVPRSFRAAVGIALIVLSSLIIAYVASIWLPQRDLQTSATPTGVLELVDDEAPTPISPAPTPSSTPTLMATVAPTNIATAVASRTTATDPATATHTPTRASTSTPAIPEDMTVRARFDVFVFQGPDSDFPIVGSLAQAEEAVIIAQNQDGTWYLLRLPNNRSGWVRADYLDASPSGALGRVEVAATIPALDTPTQQPTVALTPAQPLVTVGPASTSPPSNNPETSSTPTPAPVMPTVTATARAVPPTATPTSPPPPPTATAVIRPTVRPTPTPP